MASSKMTAPTSPKPPHPILTPNVPEPHLSLIGRDAPGYDYLAPCIVTRNLSSVLVHMTDDQISSLVQDIRAELRAAYSQGESDALRPEVERMIEEP